MNNEEQINWFGSPLKGKTKSKSHSKKVHKKKGQIDYLGMGTKSNVSYLGSGSKKIPQKFDFLGIGNKNKSKMMPSPLFRKESTKSKTLSRWGDADLDGSPNWFDCDPRNAFKDAKKIRGVMTAEQLSAMYLEKRRPKAEAEMMLQRIEENPTRATSKIKTGEAAQSVVRDAREAMRNVKLAEREARNEAIRKRTKETYEKITQPAKEQLTKTFGERGTLREAIKQRRREKKGYSELEAKKETYRLAGEEFTKKEKEYEKAKAAGTLTPQDEAYMKDITEKQKLRAASEKKMSSLEQSSKKVRELMKKPGLAGAIGVARYSVEEKMARGKKPTKKEQAALAKLEKRGKMVGDIQSEGRFSRDILTRTPGGEIGRVFTGAAVSKSGEYTAATKAKAAKVKRMVKFAAGQVFGTSLTQTSFNSEPRGRGRPAGPSGEYKIGGRPVYESDFQQYSAKQNALNRMLPSQQQSATLNPEYIAYIKAKEAAERGETKTVMTEDGMPMEGIPQADQTEGYPTMGSSMMQTGQQQLEMQQKRAYNRATPEEVKAAQYRAQAVDNPLMAPNFMKGELKAAGGSILTPIGPSILEAPQVFKGEMRNVVKTNPDEGEVKLSDRPQTNPYGDEWLDIELGSGKPVIRRRIREKWVTGEAL